MTLKGIQSEIANHIINIKMYKHVRQIDMNDIKIERSSIKILINDFKLKNYVTEMRFNDIKTQILCKGASMHINDIERHTIWDSKSHN